MSGRPRRYGNPPGALVVGANFRALGIARSLGRHGIATWLLHLPGDDLVARTSRYACRTLNAPDGDPEEQCDALHEMAVRHRLAGWTLFPTGDESLAALARERTPLSERFRCAFPGWDVARHAYHKRLTHALAERAGVEYPWTRYPLTSADVAALECRFPVILKPDDKPQENRFTDAKAWRVDTRASLVPAWTEAASLVGAHSVMVQELIPGGGEAQYSFAALCREGVPLATLVARRTRQFPRDFGHSSSLVETIDAPAIERQGRVLLAELGWDGLVELEFKHDARDDSFKLLDINGRVWTWHGLGPRAGVDFPYLAWRLSQGLSVDPVRARPGIRWARLATDVPSAVGAIAAGELSARQWLDSLSGPREPALFATDDPLPALLDPLLLGFRLGRRRLQRAIGRSSGRRALKVTPADYAGTADARV